MICKEIENMIPSFLADDLDTDDLREFMEHVDNCDECMEELSIQFLVLEGLARLETGNVFDLQNEFEIRLDEAAHNLKRREGMRGFLYILESLVVIAAAALVALLLIL